jgi:hypothetical protein
MSTVRETLSRKSAVIVGWATTVIIIAVLVWFFV